MGEHPSSLSGSASTRVYIRKAADGWIFLRSYLGFCYVCTGSYESIYDTSITEVVDIPRRNSPCYVAYAHTWILEPSVYLSGCEIRWWWLCRCLLLRLAFSELCHLAGMSIPPIPWFMTSQLVHHDSCFCLLQVQPTKSCWGSGEQGEASTKEQQYCHGIRYVCQQPGEVTGNSISTINLGVMWWYLTPLAGARTSKSTHWYICWLIAILRRAICLWQGTSPPNTNPSVTSTVSVFCVWD